MKFINTIIQLMRRNAILLMASMAAIGFLMLYLSVQNDFHSSALFLFKAVFLPLSIVFLTKIWLLAWIVIQKPTLSRKKRVKFYRKWPLGIALVVTLSFLPQLLPNWRVSPHFSEHANQHGFKVATFSAMTRSRNGQDIKAFIQAYQPQVLCLQEVTDDELKVLEGMYPYQARHAGLAILSQFAQKKMFENKAESREVKLAKKPVQAIEIGVPGKKQVLFLNIHMPRQYRKSDGYFSKALEAIQLHVDTTLPIIFCGDFNMTTRNTLYNYLTQQLGFADAQHTKAWQYGFTFPNGNRRLAYFGTWLRIDYLFSRGFLGGMTQTINASNLSDHKAVMSTFLLAE